MQIRNATPADTPSILAMGRKFYDTTHYALFADYDDATVEVLIDLMRDAGVLLLAERDGAVVGMAGLVITPFLFNATKNAAYEVMWWVDPADQGQGAGRALLAAIEPACHARGVAAIQMVHLANSPAHAGPLYERSGYFLSETSYTKVV